MYTVMTTKTQNIKENKYDIIMKHSLNWGARFGETQIGQRRRNKGEMRLLKYY